MKTNKRKYLSLAVAMAALLATPAYARLNPQVSFTVSIPGAGPLAWDSVNNVLLVGTATTLYAIAPASQAIVASQGMQSNQQVAYDSVRNMIWTVGCGSAGCEATEVSATQFLLNPGSAPTTTIALSPGATSVALDIKDAEAWITTGTGSVSEYSYSGGSVNYVQTISTPDGEPANNLLFIPGAGPGLFVMTSYVTNNTPVSSWWFWSTLESAWVWYGPDSGWYFTLEVGIPAYNSYYGVVMIPGQFATLYELNYPSELFMGDEYILNDANDNGQYLTTINSSVATLGGVSSIIEQKALYGHNQVMVFSTLDVAESYMPLPGITVPGAYYNAIGGNLVWTSGAGVVTAITYN